VVRACSVFHHLAGPICLRSAEALNYYLSSGSFALSIAFDSQAAPSFRNFSQRAGVNRTEPGTVFSSSGSAGRPRGWLDLGFVMSHPVQNFASAQEADNSPD
jgi:hypothetical protein